MDPPLSPEDQALLALDVELDPEMRTSILVLYRALDERDYYELLGVEASADKKVLKRAYYDRAARFHPDRYFRKRLGEYKVRLEAIFSKMTVAQETLGDPKKRAEYDAYLAERRRSRGIEELMSDALAEVARAEERAEREARAAEAAAAAAPPPPPVAPPPPPTPTVNVAIAARRDALARRLLGGRTSSSPGMPAAGRPSSPQMAAAPPAPPRPSTGDAMDALRRRYEDRKALARAAQARAYVQRGQEALAKGDAIGAANSFQVALGLSPDDAALTTTARRAQEEAAVILSQTYSKQAAYEENHGQWGDAARSWARVCHAAPNDPIAHDHAASALVKAGGDMHEAVRLGKRACELQPANGQMRATLATAYLAAGLMLNAKRELETAAQLAPHDGTIQAMLKRVGQQPK